MGSVKDLKVIEAPTPEHMGKGRFIFSDRYSVFDWGEMPDHIPDKGAAIAILGAYFFEKLEAMNIKTHYIGVVEDGTPKKLDQLKRPSNELEVKLLNVIRPKLTGSIYDYSIYDGSQRNILIPLEIIYRNALPPGSSVFGRLERGETTYQELGLDAMPTPNQRLARPILDASTKLEVTDRYISWNEAQKISGLSKTEIEGLKSLALQINNIITNEFSRLGLVNEDGKIEVGLDENRNLMVVDVLGTLDECRFTFDGMPVSKEIARIYYRNTPWYNAVEKAKKEDRQNWKNICRLKPEPLPPALKTAISNIYCACTNEITHRNWFPSAPPLADVLKELKKATKY